MTNAFGNHSHAEGQSSSKIPESITVNSTNDEIIAAWNSAKFNLTKAASAHTEGGNALALGAQSHAEGLNTIASGNRSHSEGIGTIANYDNQHVQGKYNDTTNQPTNGYAHIVGGGNSDTDRKNIHTLDWNGNAWFAGTINSGSPISIANGGTGYNSIEDNTYTTARYRASALVSTETTPTTNGVICWVYE